MKNLFTPLLILFFSLYSFAQEVHPDTPPQGEPDNFATPGGNPTPIDQYEYLLIFSVLIIIAMLYYKKIHKNTAN